MLDASASVVRKVFREYKNSAEILFYIVVGHNTLHTKSVPIDQMLSEKAERKPNSMVAQ